MLAHMYPPPVKAGPGLYCVYSNVEEDRLCSNMVNYIFLHDGVFKIRTRLTISRPENPKRVISQTIKTLMKFHQDLHCLPRQNRFSEKEIQYCFESLTCAPFLHIIGHPDFILCSFIEISFDPK